LLEIHRNKHFEAASSREWEQIHKRARAKLEAEVGTWNFKKFGCWRA